MISVSKLVHACLDAGRLAAERIRAVHSSGDLQCIEKGDGQDKITGRPMRDIQTEADRQAEQIIFCRILREFPGIRIIGEEQSSGTPPDCEDTSISGSTPGEDFQVPKNLGEIDIADISIFVDPLDGTSEFVKGRLHCVSVIIGIAYKSKALAGVIYRPFTTPEYPHTCMYGIIGTGAFLDGRKMEATPSGGRPRKLTTTLSKSNRIIERVYELLQPCEEAKDGGAGWKCWIVATGSVDCYQYPRPGTKRWDVLAGDAIIRALGGACTDACGRDITYTVSSDYTNTWGILLSLDKKWHYERVVPASHRALVEAANDPDFTQWPNGLIIPPIETSSL
jgi:3'(2'), 5'-bisphosphate nucleotidase